MKAYNNLHKVNIEKMNLPKKLIFIAVCTLWVHIGFSQYFNKIYQPNNLGNSYIWQVKPYYDDIIANIEKVCSDSFLCTNITRVGKDGDIIFSEEGLGYKGFWNTFAMINDTIIFGMDEFNPLDSFFYWKIAKMTVQGKLLREYKFRTLHISHVGIGSFGYNYPRMYGITLVKNNEMIIWGEGLDNRQPKPEKVAYRSVFLRVGLDGSRKGDLFWFDPSDFSIRRLSDACTDIDGNMVFNYEYGEKIETNKYSPARSIYKIMPDDSIKLIAKLPITFLDIGLPKIAVDSQGNYYVNPIVGSGLAPGYNVNYPKIGFISKVNRAGDILWTSMIPPYDYEWPAMIEATHTSEINRISTTRNGDILCTGRVFVRDSFEIVGQSQKLYVTGNGSFIARFDTDGKLLWRHFIVPHKKNGTIRVNYIYDIQEDPDGSIITGGALERDDNDIDPSFRTDAWIMRLTPDGCLTPDCSHIEKYFDFLPEIVSVADDLGTGKVTIYPNPGSEQINIQLAADIALPIQYQISNIQGMIVESGTQSERDITLDGSHLVSGMYIIAIRDSHGKLLSSKWVKE